MSLSRSILRSEPARPFSVLASIWIVALALTGYCGSELRTWTQTSTDLEGSRLLDVTARLQRIGEASGLASVHENFEHVRERLYRHRERSVPAVRVAAAPVGQLTPPPAGATAPAASTASAPAIHRVLIIGASSIQFDLGIALEQQLAQRKVVVKRFGRAATGLTQPEILDWPAKLEALLDAFPADAVLINFGGNDALAIKHRNAWIEWGAKGWDEAYGARVADLVERCKRRGAIAILIGMPVMRLKSFSQRMRELNAITQRYTEAAGGTYLSQWEYSVTPQGGYREWIDVGGQRRPMRNEDGIHYSRWGADHVAHALLDDLQRHVTIRGD